jgi:CHAD domain-containing protein
VEERELKFTPGPAFHMPDLTGIGVDTRTETRETLRLQAAYFDTDDLRLARAGASLRHRNDEGWMVKLPVSRDGMLIRQELAVAGEPGEPPEAAVDLVHALIRRAPLRLVARLNTVRQRTVLLDESGEQLAEIVDDEVSVLDGARLAARFREIEVEFTDNAAADVVDELVGELEARLDAAGAGPPDILPKVARALGPRALDPSDIAPPPELDFASAPLDVLRAALATSTARLVAHDPGVRLGTDSEDVHQARVATRRLRSDLRTFHEVVDPTWSEPLRDELRWMGERLGAVRDTDVLLERFDDRLATLPPAELDAGKHLLEGLREHRNAARDELLVAMRSERYLALLDQLVAATRFVPGSTLGAGLELELGDLVARPWRKLRNAVEALGDQPPDVELHAVRIRAKRCRYAAEAVAPAVGKPARRFARAVAEVQEVLGDHQDAVIAGQWLRAHAADGGGKVECAFVAGELAAFEAVDAEDSRAAWPEAWKQARSKRLREWM